MFTIAIKFPNVSLFSPARKPPLAQIWSKTAIKEYIVKGALLHGGLFLHATPAEEWEQLSWLVKITFSKQTFLKTCDFQKAIKFPNVSLFSPARKPPLAQIWSKTAIKEYIVKGALLHGGLFLHATPAEEWEQLSWLVKITFSKQTFLKTCDFQKAIKFPNVSLFSPARKPPLAQIWSKTAIKEYIVKGALLHGGLFLHATPAEEWEQLSWLVKITFSKQTFFKTSDFQKGSLLRIYTL